MVEEEYVCQCLKCGKPFISTELVETSYSEYPGASRWTEWVSPCCHWHYTEPELKTCPSCQEETLIVYEDRALVQCVTCHYTAQES